MAGPRLERTKHAPPDHDHLTTVSSVAEDRRGTIRKHARHRREVANVAIDEAEQRGDGRLVRRDAVEVADALRGLTLL